MIGRFDWYQATVEDEVRPLLQAVESLAEGAPRWEQMPKAPHGYKFGQRLHDASGQLCMLWWGGCHELPHLVASGDAAHDAAEFLRSAYEGKHRVTRADACIDYADPGAYERLESLALEVAKERQIVVGTAGDHKLRMEGRTLYLGAPTSHTRLRIYEKADELRRKFRWDARRLEVPDELARLECQVRPATPMAKIAAGYASPIELMGSSAWMRDLMGRVAGLELQPFLAGRPWRQADDDRAYSALLAQYGGMLERRAKDHGSWEMLGRQMCDDLASLPRKRSR